ncbi:MAG: histidine kinase [Ilumatobacteraceae bacterium]
MATSGDRHPEGSRVSTTLVLPLAAVAAALIAIFGEDDSFGAVTVVGALAGLVPWALVAGGVRIPLVAFGAWTLAAGVLVVTVGSSAGGMFPVMIALVYVAKATDDWWLIGTMVVGGAAAIVVLAIAEKSVHQSGMIYFLGGTGISLLSGRQLRQRERLVDELRAMQQLRVEHAAVEERTRIAREIHDVVAHSLTVVMLHVTGARRVLGSNPARAEEALARAESVGRESLDSIRQVVGLLRAGEEGRSATEPSQPGLDALDALVAGYRSAGVDLSVDVRFVDLDPAIGLVVYRLVQESVANALQHAPGAPCTVLIDTVQPASPYARRLHVEIANSPARNPVSTVAIRSATRPGLGVRGMRERVLAAGGTFRAGPDDAGGWRVVATLPLRAAVAVQEPSTATRTTP